VFHEGYKTTELKATYSALKEEAKAHSSVSSALQEKIDAAKAARTATGASADHKPTFLEKIGANMDGLRNEFGKLDADGSGAISAAEIKPLLARFDINMTDKMIAKTVKEVDEDDSGELDWFEFLAFVYAYGEGEDALEARFTDVQLEQMRETFALFDASGDGLISLSELSKIMKKLGRKLPREQLQAMMAEVDADGSGNIEWDEFLQFMLLTESNDNDDEYEKAFNMIDKEGRGFLYMEDVANLINQLSPGEITPEELRMMVDESKFEDENSDRLTYKEFVKMVMSN
jgi:calmodulin